MTVEAPDPLPSLPAAVEVAAYRIAQEAVTNVLRHAHARSCCVVLHLSDVLHLEVSDDGVGIDAAGEARRTGVGLGSMWERAEEIDGTVTISQAAHGGTCITVRLPFGGVSQPDEQVGRQPSRQPGGNA